MTKIPVSQDVYNAIKAGFSLPEMEIYKMDGTPKAIKKYLDVPFVSDNQEAFLDGVALRERVCFIFSADSQTDYNNDIASYDVKAKQLNEKYGDIVLTASEVKESSNNAYGLIGYRVVPFAQVTTTDFPSGEVSIERPRDTIEEVDAAVRKQLEFTD